MRVLTGPAQGNGHQGPVLYAYDLSGFGAGPDSSLLKTSNRQGILSSGQKVPEASGRTHMTPIGYSWLSWRFLVFVVELVEMHPKEQGSGNEKNAPQN